MRSSSPSTLPCGSLRSGLTAPGNREDLPSYEGKGLMTQFEYLRYLKWAHIGLPANVVHQLPIDTPCKLMRYSRWALVMVPSRMWSFFNDDAPFELWIKPVSIEECK